MFEGVVPQNTTSGSEIYMHDSIVGGNNSARANTTLSSYRKNKFFVKTKSSMIEL